MTGKTLRNSGTIAVGAAAQLDLDRKAVALRLGGPSAPPLSQTMPYVAGVSFAEAVAAAKFPRKRSGKPAKSRPDAV
jgi:hypothetical protein